MEENEVKKKTGKGKVIAIIIGVIVVAIIAVGGYVLPTYVFPNSYIAANIIN